MFFTESEQISRKTNWGYQIVRQTCLDEETHNKEETQPFFRDLMRRYSTKSGI
jgi:hypothetical protein